MTAGNYIAIYSDVGVGSENLYPYVYDQIYRAGSFVTFIVICQNFSCGGTNRGYGRGTGAANTGGGFWTGMGVGGLMGYMFGNRG